MLNTFLRRFVRKQINHNVCIYVEENIELENPKE